MRDTSGRLRRLRGIDEGMKESHYSPAEGLYRHHAVLVH